MLDNTAPQKFYSITQTAKLCQAAGVQISRAMMHHYFNTSAIKSHWFIGRRVAEKKDIEKFILSYKHRRYWDRISPVEGEIVSLTLDRIFLFNEEHASIVVIRYNWGKMSGIPADFLDEGLKIVVKPDQDNRKGWCNVSVLVETKEVTA
jgi:hypothetical protein